MREHAADPEEAAIQKDRGGVRAAARADRRERGRGHGVVHAEDGALAEREDVAAGGAAVERPDRDAGGHGGHAVDVLGARAGECGHGSAVVSVERGALADEE